MHRCVCVRARVCVCAFILCVLTCPSMKYARLLSRPLMNGKRLWSSVCGSKGCGPIRICHLIWHLVTFKFAFKKCLSAMMVITVYTFKL